ncbi:MAG: hypothetical protein Q7V10_02520 [Methanobacteriaceae archaeon]|nr:hypothetical protein [Methanobacteriaceae archaeon]MDO9626083.1 hypothetical protein [Methanobacteriaceae archaeon]
MIITFAGLLIGFFLTGIMDVRQAPISNIVLIIAEVALVLVLFSDASRVKLGSLKSNILNMFIHYRINLHHWPGYYGGGLNIHRNFSRKNTFPR